MQPQHPLSPASPHAGTPYSPNQSPDGWYPAQQYPAQQYPAGQYPAWYSAASYQGAQPAPAAGFGASPASVSHWILPTGRSWQSIAAGYVGLFAVVAWFLGPVALGLGVWALVKASRDGSHGRGRAVFGAVVGALATLLLLAVLATT